MRGGGGERTIKNVGPAGQSEKTVVYILPSVKPVYRVRQTPYINN